MGIAAANMSRVAGVSRERTPAAHEARRPKFDGVWMTSRLAKKSYAVPLSQETPDALSVSGMLVSYREDQGFRRFPALFMPGFPLSNGPKLALLDPLPNHVLVVNDPSLNGGKRKGIHMHLLAKAII
jgi:hypothetical protein